MSLAFKFGAKSLARLKECDQRLQDIAQELIKHMDVSILCGHRDEESQNRAYTEKKSRLKWPNSKHNKKPSLAIDIAPYPIDWNDLGRFKKMCEIVEAIAREKNIKIRLGRDFSFKDWPHIELMEA